MRRTRPTSPPLKTAVKKFEAAVASGNREQADSAYKAAVKSVDQGVKKGILHKNNAARKKSSMTPEAQQAGLILLKISPSEFVQKEFFSFLSWDACRSTQPLAY